MKKGHVGCGREKKGKMATTKKTDMYHCLKWDKKKKWDYFWLKVIIAASLVTTGTRALFQWPVLFAPMAPSSHLVNTDDRMQSETIV